MINKLSTKLLTGFVIKVLFSVSILFSMILNAGGQTDTLRQNIADTLYINNDTILSQNKPADSTHLGISPNAVKSTVDYKAKDSIRLDVKTQKVYLYNEDDISYEDINLKANYVEITFPENTVYATGTKDSLGNLTGKPVFTMAQNKFESESMKYDYKSKKGLVQKVITEDNQGYLHGEKVKKMPDDVTNVYEGSYTTCDKEHPDYEFRFKRAKVIPNKKIITGPAYFVVEDVPTPLFIPFGMFPNKSGQRSGIVVPTYGESKQRGFYFENGGYYFAINDYLDLRLVGDIYTLGSWAVKPLMNYKKRYKYSGALNLNYSLNILGEEGSTDYSKTKSFSIRWSHSQDPKARPNSRFSANVNIVSSQYNKFNPTSSTDYLSNTFQSSINYSTNWASKYFLTVAFNHSQNVITGELNLTLPKLTFNVNQFYPFRKKVAVGSMKWWDNISVKYNMTTENRINTYDSIIFKQNISNDLQNGMNHSIQISSGSIKVLKHIVWSNNFNYTERWYTQQHIKSWRSDTLYLNEGPVSGFVGTDTIYGFNAARDYNFSSSLSTTIYGMFAYKKGPVKAIRHVIKPSVSFNFRPDFGTQSWGYYKYYINQSGESQKYSVYDGFIYGTPPDGKSGSIGFRLSNNLEMKVRSLKDTITGTKKIVLIEDFSISTNYDIARDSLNWSNLGLSGRTTLFKNLVVNYSSVFSPYATDSTGKTINTFQYKVNHKLFRPQSSSWRLGLTLKLNSDLLSKEKKSTAGTTQELNDVNKNPENYVDWNVPWNLDISYDFNFNTSYLYLRTGYWDYNITKDKNLIQTIGFNGTLNVTPKWKVGIRSGYDLQNNDLTYTSINVYRDLHCWQMSFNWIPYGFRQSWSFTINIKSSLLQDLKLDKKKDFRDF